MGSAVWTICVGYLFLLFLPALVGGMVDGLGFTTVQVGYVASAQLAGMMAGAAIGAALVSSSSLRWGVAVSMLCLAPLEITSAFTQSAPMMTGLRFATGICCGFASSMVAACITTMREPTRVFGLAFAAQFTVGALGLFGMPYLGIRAGLFVLAAAACTAVITARWLPTGAGDRSREAGHDRGQLAPLLSAPVILVLGSLFLFYCLNNAMWAFLERIGVHAGISGDVLGVGLGLSMLAGIAGGAVAFAIGDRLGRILPLAMGLFGLTWGAWTLTGGFSVPVYFSAAAVFNGGLAFSVTYYLGYCAALDSSGRIVILANLVITAGLAVGPAVGAHLVGREGYDFLLLVCGAGFIGVLALGAAGIMSGPALVAGVRQDP